MKNGNGYFDFQSHDILAEGRRERLGTYGMITINKNLCEVYRWAKKEMDNPCFTVEVLLLIVAGVVDYWRVYSFERPIFAVATITADDGGLGTYQGVGNDEKSKYWKIAAIYGDEFINAGIVWADKAISILKER